MKLFKHSSICQSRVLQVECRVWFQIIICRVVKKGLGEEEKNACIQTALWLKCTNNLFATLTMTLINVPHVYNHSNSLDDIPEVASKELVHNWKPILTLRFGDIMGHFSSIKQP